MYKKMRRLQYVIDNINRDDSIFADIEDIINLIIKALKRGKKVIFCGNGGSNADAEHIVAEFTGKFKLNRPALPAVNLGSNISSITAIGNDYGFDDVFSRQVEALGNKGDILIALSTSGESENVVDAVRKANEMGIQTFGITGMLASGVDMYCPNITHLPTIRTDIIQEITMIILHYIVEQVESRMCGGVENVAQ